MWQTNDDMVRGLTRFSWVGGWIAFACAAAAFLLGLASILLGNTLWPSTLIAGIGSGLMVTMLGRLQRVHALRAKVKTTSQPSADQRSTSDTGHD